MVVMFIYWRVNGNLIFKHHKSWFLRGTRWVVLWFFRGTRWVLNHGNDGYTIF
jgi:hypothetical protein